MGIYIRTSRHTGVSVSWWLLPFLLGYYAFYWTIVIMFWLVYITVVLSVKLTVAAVKATVWAVRAVDRQIPVIQFHAGHAWGTLQYRFVPWLRRRLHRPRHGM